MEFVSKYKFIIAIENAVCYDYVTEKLWRSLIVGSVPIYLGSPVVEVGFNDLYGVEGNYNYKITDLKEFIKFRQFAICFKQFQIT